MSKYIEAFNKVADGSSETLVGYPIKTWFHIDESSPDVSEVARDLAANAVKTVAAKPIELVGKCFGAVSAISLRLLQNQIKHTVTIGDVLVDGVSYFGATHTSLLADMQGGSDVDTPAAAHAWITLSNGVIVDATLNSSLAYKFNNALPEWDDAIYSSVRPNERVEHVPLMLGTEYQLKAVVNNDEFAQHFFLSYSQRISRLLEGA